MRCTQRSWLLSKAVKIKLNIGPIKRIDKKIAGILFNVSLFVTHELDENIAELIISYHPTLSMIF